MNSIDIRRLMVHLSAVMDGHRDELIRLDGQVGDGDLGLTMSKGFKVASEETMSSSEGDIGKLLMRAGMAMAKSAPSTMGTLVATGFISGGKAVSGGTELDAAAFASFLSSFVEGVMQRGKSKPGEKTLLDVLYPAAEALKEAVSSGATLSDALSACRRAAEAGYEESKQLIAQHGRAAYYREQSIGKEDPGAAAALYFVQGLHEFISEQE